MNTLKEYLINARQFNKPKLRALVFGNPSADMDSVVASITMSWYCGIYKPGYHLYTPVINCPRKELPLRIEIVEHLNKFGINE